jgi:hypothetical protein
MALTEETSSPLFKLGEVLGEDWPNLRKAFAETQTVVNELGQLLSAKASADSSIVVTGSIGRKEYTQSSDLDWYLLVDGAADARDQKTFLTVEQLISGVDRFKKGPGKEGTFGKLVFSQPIIHLIGGEEDSNKNTTRRILLLLEAIAIGESRAFDRVRKGILRRYLDEDKGLFRKDDIGNTRWVPLFLLNDLTRYWRTIAVDFAYKQFDRGNKGYSLRSVKLGTSRKLMFASGLLACFWCDPQISKIDGQEKQVQGLIDNLDEYLTRTPLERIALFFNAHLDSRDASFLKRNASAMFSAYDQFIELLNENESRDRLERLQEGKRNLTPRSNEQGHQKTIW